jgi:hypothetical protein
MISFFKKKTKMNFIIQIKKNIELNHPGHSSLRKSPIKKNYLKTSFGSVINLVDKTLNRQVTGSTY